VPFAHRRRASALRSPRASAAMDPRDLPKLPGLVYNQPGVRPSERAPS
jgi:hypothetical protein